MAPLWTKTSLFILCTYLIYVFSILVQDVPVPGVTPAVTSEKTVIPVVIPEPNNAEVKKEETAPVKQEMKEIEKSMVAVVEEEQDDDDFVVVENEEEDM